MRVSFPTGPALGRAAPSRPACTLTRMPRHLGSSQGPLLTGRGVVITGAASGIGRALALEAARRGARVALSDVDLPGLEETANLVTTATGTRPRTDPLDVRDEAAWGAYAETVAADLGTVHVLVNNAGVALTGPFEDLAPAQFDRVIDINFAGVVRGTRAFLPHLVASGDGHLVNISSLFGLMAVPGQTAYVAAKFAVRGFTEALRQDMLMAGHPVRVTSVHPGGVRTAIARNADVAPGVDRAERAEFFERRLAKTSPERAAEVIIDGMLAGKPRVLVGRDAHTMDALVRALGSRYHGLVVRRLGDR